MPDLSQSRREGQGNVGPRGMLGLQERNPGFTPNVPLSGHVTSLANLYICCPCVGVLEAWPRTRRSGREHAFEFFKSVCVCVYLHVTWILAGTFERTPFLTSVGEMKTRKIHFTELPWWLKLQGPGAGGVGSILGQGTTVHMLQLKSLHTTTKSGHSQINK